MVDRIAIPPFQMLIQQPMIEGQQFRGKDFVTNVSKITPFDCWTCLTIQEYQIMADRWPTLCWLRDDAVIDNGTRLKACKAVYGTTLFKYLNHAMYLEMPSTEKVSCAVQRRHRLSELMFTFEKHVAQSQTLPLTDIR